MRIGRRETRRRLIGLTLPTLLGTGGGGANWTFDKGDRGRARSVLQRLEDRRVLYDPFEVEQPHRCVRSVMEIRESLRDCIEQCESSELRDPLRAIQAACRQFLTDTQAAGGDGRSYLIVENGASSWLFNQALGAFRARAGTSVAVIISTFDLEIDEHLAKILPPPPDEGDSDPAQDPRRFDH